MNSVVRIIIPSVDDVVVLSVVGKITQRYGGATYWTANGTYVRGDTGSIDFDPVTVLEVSLDLTLAEHGWFLLLAGDVRRKLGQESVFLSTRSEAGQLVGP